ncbi:hypothetical protein LZ30DRAFT_827925 [Colletotrichum cereale]|nr:hypothetical protein LZ30DRAFT_827925 [Colletotrichum cereale]
MLAHIVAVVVLAAFTWPVLGGSRAWQAPLRHKVQLGRRRRTRQRIRTCTTSAPRCCGVMTAQRSTPTPSRPGATSRAYRAPYEDSIPGIEGDAYVLPNDKKSSRFTEFIKGFSSKRNKYCENPSR